MSIVDRREEHRFELERDGVRAELVYRRTPHTLVLVHTEVPPALEGRGIGAELVRKAVAEGRAAGLQIVPLCPFARAYLERHPELLTD